MATLVTVIATLSVGLGNVGDRHVAATGPLPTVLAGGSRSPSDAPPSAAPTDFDAAPGASSTPSPSAQPAPTLSRIRTGPAARRHLRVAVPSPAALTPSPAALTPPAALAPPAALTSPAALTPPAALAAPAAAAPVVGTPCTSTAQACVDVTARKAWLIGGGVVTRGPVSVRIGDLDDPTPVGTFLVQMKADGGTSRQEANPMPFAVFFADGIAFHERQPDSEPDGSVTLSHGNAEAWFAALQIGDEVQVH